jgi:hypothetical protein
MSCEKVNDSVVRARADESCRLVDLENGYRPIHSHYLHSRALVRRQTQVTLQDPLSAYMLNVPTK